MIIHGLQHKTLGVKQASRREKYHYALKALAIREAEDSRRWETGAQPLGRRGQGRREDLAIPA